MRKTHLVLCLRMSSPPRRAPINNSTPANHKVGRTCRCRWVPAVIWVIFAHAPKVFVAELFASLKVDVLQTTGSQQLQILMCCLFGQPAAQCLEGPCHNHALQLRKVTMCELVCKIIHRKAPPAHELDTTLYTNAAEVPKVVKHTRRTAPKGLYDRHKFPAHTYFE